MYVNQATKNTCIVQIRKYFWR